jgi:thiol-disulfide isomerase/thioredoxin
MRALRLALLGLAALGLSAGLGLAGPLEPFGRGSWKKILAAHGGRPLVVHFWGLSCSPCRKEMPHWGELLAGRPDAPIVMINADIVPNEIDDAQKFLQQSGLGTAENWIFEDDFVERLRYEVDPKWQGEIPLTLLIASDGTKTVIEGAAPAHVVVDWLDAQTEKPR